MDAVDVIVPVYRAAEDLARCLASLRAHTPTDRHRVLLVPDGPQPPAVDTLTEAARDWGAEVAANPARGGFVHAVNHGLAHLRGDGARRDVVLLNSDTEVTAGWLDRLARAAASDPRVATVTPFSNNATICSLPRALEENELPAGHDLASMARLVEDCARPPLYPRLPTGVGFCLYVKGRVLDEVGLLDAEGFGLGYGEEVDFCLRAAVRGYVHVLDDATYVWHAGESSFGPLGRPGAFRARRVRAAHRVLARRWPDYQKAVARFLEDDPVAPARERVRRALSPPRERARRAGIPARVVHVVHGWPPHNHAGTELYARWLVTRQTRDREVAVYSRVGRPERPHGHVVEGFDHGARVRLKVHNFTHRNPLVRNGLHDGALLRDFDRFLEETRPELVHVHHLAGHAATLLRPAVRRGLPILYQIQDWWTGCARVNRFHREGYLCDGPAPRKCSHCLPLTGRPPRGFWNPLLHRLRRRLLTGALRSADGHVTGSRFLHRTFLEQGLLRPDDRVWVTRYGVDLEDLPSARARKAPPGSPLRFGFIGSIMPHKGALVAVRAFLGVDPERATLDLWGDPTALPAYTEELRRNASTAVRLRGRFPEDGKADLFAALDVLVIPSLGWESYGLAAREAISAGVPVLVSHQSALAELVDDLPEGVEVGASFPPGDADALAGLVTGLIEDPDRIAQWRRHLPSVRGMDEHAAEIDDIYAEILSRRVSR